MDCRSIIDNGGANFYQLSAVVKDVRRYLNSLRTKEELIRISLFEIPQKLVIPLQNLDDLTTILFKKTGLGVNEEQQRYLIQCKRTVVTFYCYIQFFVKLLIDKDQSKPTINSGGQTRRVAYEFYHNAYYELTTPYHNLKLYAQAKTFEAETRGWAEFISQIYSSPFVPEHQEEVEKISYWTEELGKFMNDIPRLRREFSDDNTA